MKNQPLALAALRVQSFVTAGETRQQRSMAPSSFVAQLSCPACAGVVRI